MPERDASPSAADGRSPVATELDVEFVVGGVDLGEPRLHPDGTSVLFTRSDDGDAVFVRRWLSVDGPDAGSPMGDETIVCSTPAPRPGRGLGGGCWCFSAAGDALIVAAVDGNVWWQPIDGSPSRQLTDHGPERLTQAPVAVPDGTGVVVIVDQAEVWWHPVEPSDLRPPRRLDDDDADFVFDPVVSPDSRSVAWVAWDVPDMPWDRGRIELVDLVDHQRRTITSVGSYQQPRFAPDGRLLAVCDDDGWRNLHVVGSGVVLPERCEHGGPSWGLGQRSFAVSPDGARVAFTRNERGFGSLCVATLDRDGRARAVQLLGRGVHGQVSWVGDRIAALRSGAVTPPEIVVYQLDDDTAPAVRHRVTSSARPGLDRALLAEPELVEVPTPGGAVVHARLYRAPVELDRPRALCWLHGGPTDQWQVAYLPRIAYWRSRGWNVLVPDHRGSTGHGREYQRALEGRWGELDVADTVTAVRHLHRLGLSTPATTALIGGSAGGFTVLGALRAEPELVAGAVVAYPVCDLADLVERSHRFERHATDRLVGPLDGSERMAARYRERSPVWFADQLTTPLLVFHGEDDPVVPVGQSRVLVERLRALGRDVELVVYPGEGHGFRQRAHQIDEYERTGAFLARTITG
jgi:dipeptidyl aminopeptidase/acylaminoacyl peptidase